jgi:hypothetical protein
VIAVAYKRAFKKTKQKTQNPKTKQKLFYEVCRLLTLRFNTYEQSADYYRGLTDIIEINNLLFPMTSRSSAPKPPGKN